MSNLKKNNKGFMLVEVIIVTVVVATIMTSLYVVFNRVYTGYEKKSMYTNIDGIYALKMIEEYGISDISSLIGSDSYKLIYGYSDADGFFINECVNNSVYCSKADDVYNINAVYVVKKDILSNDEKLEDFKSSITNQTFKDYVDYLKNIIKPNDGNAETDITYLMLIETYYVKNDKNTAKYAYLPIK